MNAENLTRCIHCTAWINPKLGAKSPTGESHAGTKADPRPPGDWDNICDLCNYGKGLRGGPDSRPAMTAAEHNAFPKGRWT